MKESQTEKEDVRQQQKGEGHDRYDKKNQIRRQSGRKKKVGGSVSCWPLIVKKKAWLHPGWEDTMLRWFSWLYEVKKKDEEKRIEVEHEKFNGVERRSADSEGGRRRCQAVDTEHPRSQAFGRFDCITSVQKQTPGYADALLRSVGTCWKML